MSSITLHDKVFSVEKHVSPFYCLCIPIIRCLAVICVVFLCSSTVSQFITGSLQAFQCTDELDVFFFPQSLIKKLCDGFEKAITDRYLNVIRLECKISCKQTGTHLYIFFLALQQIFSVKVQLTSREEGNDTRQDCQECRRIY